MANKICIFGIEGKSVNKAFVENYSCCSHGMLDNSHTNAIGTSMYSYVLRVGTKRPSPKIRSKKDPEKKTIKIKPER